MPNIRNFLDLSTAHLTPATRAMLDDADMSDWPCSGGKTAYGFFIWATEQSNIEGTDQPNEDTREVGMPVDLWRVMAYARAHGADYILFDADAPYEPDLPSFDDEAGEA